MPTQFLTLCAALLITLSLAACRSAHAENPSLGSTRESTRTSVATTATATAAVTGTATATLTLLPTQTPAPTGTSTPTQAAPTEIPLLPRQYLAGAGFSFTPLLDKEFRVTALSPGVIIRGKDLIISFRGVLDEPASKPPAEMVDDYLTALFQHVPGNYEKQPAPAIQVDGMDGQAFDLTGTMDNAPFAGQAIFVSVAENQYLFGMGMANTDSDLDGWKNAGAPVFYTMLQSIQFTQQLASGAQCPVSTDASYGYSYENPIKVGGDYLAGSAREHGYLAALLGPHGEKITYERTGEYQAGTTILDIFTIKVDGQAGSKKLYLDEYSYEPPVAPAGFTCGSPVPLRAP